jgi:hypothetical protein
LDRNIGGEEGVALTECAHGDVLCGPFADAREAAQARNGLSEITTWIEQMRVGTYRSCNTRNGSRAGSRNPRSVNVSALKFGPRKAW